ncbi:hypothetical protein Mgra_00004663 [Meloidogyne graminicola]|uniref:Uncharacterized protein n=1 Tax=Meloidogyne graminicola TaxID=189291 RepID=A0A8S9ZRT0_9BILA|nr:hypothetical protein Mgra_00004663 [Meloidogyne graminicola]
MSARAPIERWSRNELEERFHNVSDEVKILKQNNQKMQKEIKIMNGRISAGNESSRKQNNNELDELQRTNKVLSQKLKVLKHQLLNYSTTNTIPTITKIHQKLMMKQIIKYGKNPTNSILENKNELKEIEKNNLNKIDELEKLNNRLKEIIKQNKTIIAENDDLRFSLEKSEKKLLTLSKEYDKIVIELTNTKNGYQSQSESLSSFREEFQRRIENSSKTAQISDRELAILREEYNTLKIVYNKLINHSLEEENNGKKTIEELNRLRTELKQNNYEIDYERQQFEQKLNKLNLQNEQLKKELLLEKERNSINKINLNKNEKKEKYNEEEKEEENKIKEKQTNSSDKEDILLNKLFKDVISIIENDIKFIGNKKIINENNEGIKGLEENFRWHKMYEEVYEELEKIRQLLFNEHELNNRLKDELKQKIIENEDLKEKYENKLNEIEKELIKKDNETFKIEKTLKSIIDGKEIFNNNNYSTELSLTISKLILTENCLNLIENKNPTIFIAIGINIELYYVQNDMNYKFCSKAIISLKKLLSIKTQTYLKII